MSFAIGHLLDDPVDFFPWINHAISCLGVFKAVGDSGFCKQLEDGPLSAEELSAKIAWPADKVSRVAEYLAAEGVVEVRADGTIVGTERSRNLAQVASCVESSLHGINASMLLDQALKQGVTPYEAAFGKPVFDHFADEPEVAANFGDFMGFMTRRVEKFLFSQHEFKPFKLAADIGGNHGGLLQRLLADHPDARGILFDLPEVAELFGGAVQASEHGDRVEVVGGNFFESVPAADLYLIKMILHDWNDEECINILQSVRAAIMPGGRVSVIDHVLPEGHEMNEARSMDIAMMIWDSGKERKLSDFEALFDASGFKLDRVTPNPNGQSVIEAVPV